MGVKAIPTLSLLLGDALSLPLLAQSVGIVTLLAPCGSGAP
jgi:hypothetical protein